MKKVLFSLFFICVLMTSAFASYTVDNVNVSATVERSGKTEVTSTIQLTFTEETTSFTIPLPDADAKSISTGDYRSRVKRGDDGTNVVISRSGGFMGTQTFMVSYTVPAHEDTDDEADAYDLGFLSSRWGKDIGSCTFSLVLPGSSGTVPENFKLAPDIISGYYGSLSAADCGLTVTETTVSGTVSDMMAYDSLAVSLSLPEGYFYVRESAVPEMTITVFTIAMAMILLLVLLYWWRRIFVFPESSSRRILMPEGLLPCQLPQVLNTVTCDIPALILEWANLGYLTIGKSKNGNTVLTQRLPMGSERGEAEQKLFRRIFANGKAVAATPGRFAAPAAQFRKTSRNSLNELMLDPKGGSLNLIEMVCRLLTGVGVGFMLYRLLPEGGAYVVIAALLGIVGFLYGGHLSAFVYRARTQRYVPLKTLWVPVLAVLIVIGGFTSGGLPEAAVGLLASILSGILSSMGPRRNSRGQETMYQVRGLKKFYRHGSWQTIRQYLQRDNRFFQNQLPKAVALNSQRPFAGSCQQLPISRPDWLVSPGPARSTAKALTKELKPYLRQLREAFR